MLRIQNPRNKIIFGKHIAVFFLLGNSPSSESPKIKNITFRTRRIFEIKKAYIYSTCQEIAPLVCKQTKDHRLSRQPHADTLGLFIVHM
jgi:hypothetical protein